MPSKCSATQADLEPIPAGQLEIASLARGLGTAADAGRPLDHGAQRLVVGLHRENLGPWNRGGYFTLKMLMVRALRRSLKTAVIEVDDADGPASGDDKFEICLEPHDPKALEKATRTVKRVLRSRRWRMG
jgi:hypothetical protein